VIEDAPVDAPPPSVTSEPLLDVRDLRTLFVTDDGLVGAVDGVSFSLEAGKTLGIVGESGSGKSVTCLSIMGLNPKSARRSGEAHLRGENLLTAAPRRLREIRGNEIAMIFQDPMTSLNPVLRIGDQLKEAVLLHADVSQAQARKRAVEAMKEVGISQAERRVDDYPHQFSGGMRQRVMIAMALINDPAVLIADEPTTALDVTTQAQIINLIADLQREHGTAVIMITHDLGVVAEIADDVVVMYAARVVEHAGVDELFEAPRHPYTWGLLGSLPRLDAGSERLVQIPGQPPSLLSPPKGCRFNPRCPYRFDRCVSEDPRLMPASGSPMHLQACFLDDETKAREAAKTLKTVSA
jgi:peptide/nickel transport system ATP-binding protein